jgi:hypothetical protein
MSCTGDRAFLPRSLMPDAAVTVAPVSKRSRLIASVIALVVVISAGKLLYDHVELRLRVIFACDQVAIFEEMRVKASQSEPIKAVGYLEYVVRYYPSGTKQAQGSKLDAVVEASRRLAVHAILADLRARSGKDFGHDPEEWIANLKSSEPE